MGKIIVITVVGGFTAFVLYEALGVRERIDRFLFDRDIARCSRMLEQQRKVAEERLAAETRVLDALADDLRAEIEELGFDAQEKWWLAMDSTLQEIRNLPVLYRVEDL